MSKGKVLSAVKRQCVECMGNHPRYVEGCTSTTCPLFPYRLGKDPDKKNIDENERERRRTQFAVNLSKRAAS